MDLPIASLRDSSCPVYCIAHLDYLHWKYTRHLGGGWRTRRTKDTLIPSGQFVEAPSCSFDCVLGEDGRKTVLRKGAEAVKSLQRFDAEGVHVIKVCSRNTRNCGQR